MKNFLKASLMVLTIGFALASQSQVVSRKSLDSTANSATKYITWTNVPTGTTGFTLSAIKASSGGGTASGYAILQVRTDTLPTVSTAVFEDYYDRNSGRRDTLFITDLTTYQIHTFAAPEPLFINGARLKIVTSGTQKVYLRANVMKR